ncbi:hypothetical protein RHSIM_Rhsim02G0209300 [Rhododendron simsii]|uniref:Uncharacterized protein n=1 Tax=Rhododendron simsii TaxID=118357 RepID=A0A834HAE6_RHOSS|nr:hypothetical protein RHSIM_Rhsim02G0209300 [Rhododendron simsii]
MINRDNEMVPVSVVDTDEDAHASVEDQNMEIDPPIDGGISCLHESAHEIDKEKNGMHLVNNDMYQQQGDAESVVEVSNVHANCTTGDIMDVPYPHFTDLCQNGYLWRVKARLVRMVEVINPLLPSMTLRLILLDEQAGTKASVGPILSRIDMVVTGLQTDMAETGPQMGTYLVHLAFLALELDSR